MSWKTSSGRVSMSAVCLGAAVCLALAALAAPAMDISELPRAHGRGAVRLPHDWKPVDAAPTPAEALASAQETSRDRAVAPLAPGAAIVGKRPMLTLPSLEANRPIPNSPLVPAKRPLPPEALSLAEGKITVVPQNRRPEIQLPSLADVEQE